MILCSSSENSDIITLAESREAETDSWEEPVAKEAEEATSEELDLGSSSSSQYTFRESETSEWCFHAYERHCNDLMSRGIFLSLTL